MFSGIRCYRQCQLLAPVAIVAAVYGPVRSDEKANARDVLARVEAGRSKLRNIHLLATWEEEKKGARRYEYQILDADELGRMRVRPSERGSFDSAGNRVPGEPLGPDLLYDGEKTVTMFLYSSYDAEGRAPTDPRWRGAAGYKTTRITNGVADGGPQSYRTLISLIRDTAVEVLKRCVERPRQAQIDVDEGADDCKLRYKSNEIAIEAWFDVGKDWVPTRITERPAHGKSFQELSATYKEFKDGICLPVDGYMRSTKGDDRSEVLTEWVFHVTEAVVNNPNFDESVFKLEIEHPSGVHDQRYNVAYVTGGEKLIDDNLDAMAQKAQEQRLSQRSGEPLPTRRRWYLVAVTVVSVLALIIIMMRRKAADR